MAVRAPGLAAGLSRSFPKLGPHEWDFRWVESKEQEATVVAYERGREIIRLARATLGAVLGDEVQAGEVWSRFVTRGGLERLMEARRNPGGRHYDLAKALEALLPTKHRYSAKQPVPPPAYEIRKTFKRASKSRAAKPCLIFQEQVELPWRPDEEGEGAPDDAFALMGWGDCPVRWPSRPVVIHVPMFRALTRQEAKSQFQRWAVASGMFQGPGRTNESGLLELAFFRFNQGRPALGLAGLFAQQFDNANVRKGSVNKVAAAHGRAIFQPFVGASYGGPNVLWSSLLKKVSNELSPLAARLANEAKVYYDRWLPPDHVFKRPPLDDLRKPI